MATLSGDERAHARPPAARLCHRAVSDGGKRRGPGAVLGRSGAPRRSAARYDSHPAPAEEDLASAALRGHRGPRLPGRAPGLRRTDIQPQIDLDQRRRPGDSPDSDVLTYDLQSITHTS